MTELKSDGEFVLFYAQFALLVVERSIVSAMVYVYIPGYGMVLRWSQGSRLFDT